MRDYKESFYQQIDEDAEQLKLFIALINNGKENYVINGSQSTIILLELLYLHLFCNIAGY